MKSKRFSQSQDETLGIRLTMTEILRYSLLVITSPENALKIPKAVSGPTVDFISLHRNSQMVIK